MPKGKNVPEEIDGFRKAFDELLEKAGIDQLVVLIDDLSTAVFQTRRSKRSGGRATLSSLLRAPFYSSLQRMESNVIEYAVRKRTYPILPRYDRAANLRQKLPRKTYPGSVPHPCSRGERDSHLCHLAIRRGRTWRGRPRIRKAHCCCARATKAALDGCRS